MPIPRCPKWMQKWCELEKLVWKKYEGYVSIIGLCLYQFDEHKGAHVQLTIRKYGFYIGHGLSRLTAINMAIRTVRTNKELSLTANVDEGHFLSLNQPEDAKKLEDEIRIINKCAT